MKYPKVIIIVEGQTGKGGSANYLKFKNEVLRLLTQQKDVLVTSLLDFFRLPTSFPQYEEADLSWL